MLSIDDMIELHKMKTRAAKNFNARTTVSYTAEEHEQLAEWLEELKAIKEMDLSIPQHFTKEQSNWIKAYCIKRNIESYNEAIDDFAETVIQRYHELSTTLGYTEEIVKEIAEQLKEGEQNEQSI